MSHDLIHLDGRGSCVCGCGQCRAVDGKCLCRDCPCHLQDGCQNAGCMLCRLMWTPAGRVG
jgi:hypothetical protein